MATTDNRNREREISEAVLAKGQSVPAGDQPMP
jgi:hypothetical protein